MLALTTAAASIIRLAREAVADAIRPAPPAPALDVVVQHAGFRTRARRVPIDALIIHESVTHSLASTVAVLERKGMGVQLAIEPTGRVVELAPPHLVTTHAGDLNGRSIAIELVQPYYPLRPGRAAHPWERTIPAPWAHLGEYTLPLPAQLDALHQLVGQLLVRYPTIPDTFVGLVGHRMAMGLVAGAAVAPGIHAHHYTAHADGGFPALYLYLRRRLGLGHLRAYARAVELATGAGRWIDLSTTLEAS